MIENLKECKLCPFECKVNRLEGKKGRCNCDDKLLIALSCLHYYEEPCISGKKRFWNSVFYKLQFEM